MSLVLSSHTKKSRILSNAAPVNPAVKAWQPFKQREEKKASLGEEQFSGLFSGSNIRRIEGFTFNFNRPCSSGESSDQSKPRKRHVIISDDSDSD